MKTLVELVQSDKGKSKGNHRVEVVGDERKFYYYTTVICQANDNNKVFSIDDSYGSKSTKRACNWYHAYFTAFGYEEV